jgi:hypothetical protein
MQNANWAFRWIGVCAAGAILAAALATPSLVSAGPVKTTTVTETFTGVNAVSFFDTLGLFGPPAEVAAEETFSFRATATMPVLPTNGTFLAPATLEVSTNGGAYVPSDAISPYLSFIFTPFGNSVFMSSNVIANSGGPCASAANCLSAMLDVFQGGEFEVDTGSPINKVYVIPTHISLVSPDTGVFYVDENGAKFGLGAGDLTSIDFTSRTNLFEPIPDASTWMLTLVGFGACGAALRMRRRSMTLTQA